MKHTSRILVLLIVTLVSSCKMASLTIEVLNPADITVPGEIKKLAVANRSLPDKEHQAMNVIEGVLTGEGLFVDRFASEEAIKGFTQLANSSPRYNVVAISGLEKRGTGTALFPEPLSWYEVEKVCQQHNVDALLCLETFDSDNRVAMKERQREEKRDGATIRYIEYNANLVVDIHAGWRLYYPKTKRIIDGNVVKDYLSWNATDRSGGSARQKLPPLDRAVQEAGFHAGRRYAARISPTWVPVQRSYYKKANDDFKKAQRFVISNNWEKAAEVWRQYTKDADSKIASYACYNMALAAEMKGDFEDARQWLEKSYTEYGNKNARQYLGVIQRRISNKAKLDQQLEE